jgi:hypothetical protein
VATASAGGVDIAAGFGIRLAGLAPCVNAARWEQLVGDLVECLGAGYRKIRTWTRSIGVVRVPHGLKQTALTGF